MPNHPPGNVFALKAEDVAQPRWTLQLLGRFQLGDGQRVHTRLVTRAVTALLARLVLWPKRDHSREELAELLWPGADANTGRRRLRQALSLLKDVLEPAEQHGLAPVLQADRLNLRLVPGTLQCDVHAFERHANAGDAAAALAVYTGDLLPGFYDDWICDERQRLASMHGTLLERTPSLQPVPHAHPAPLPTARSRERAHLPSYLTRYHGNAAQLSRLAERVAQHRWVTLVGPGGAGKTRLAVELARRLHADPATPFDRVLFVPLVSAMQRQQAVDSLARALDIEASNPTVEAVIARLSEGRTLLVLDNCEQLAGLAEALWLQLTEAVPGLHLLLTSRRRMHVEGEQLVDIAPLDWPALDAAPQEVANSPSVALFVDRAMAVRADFHVSPRNHAVLAELMAALEGMPLAIELAASRLRSVSPADMLARLRAGQGSPGSLAGATPLLDLLARPSERTTLEPRHASMLRTIDWSWQQLDTSQRELLGAMAVFGGGCSLRMLQHVSGGGSQLLAVMEALLSHSLVQSRSVIANGDGAGAAEGDTYRFTLFEPVREYAGLQFEPGQVARWRARHRGWAIDWARGLPSTPSLAEVRAELPNISAALSSAACDDAGEDAVLLLLALHHTLEDVELPHAALADASAAVDACRDPLLRSRGHSAVGPLLYAAGQKDASLRHVEAALEAMPADPAHRAHALYAAARLRWRSDMQHPERVLPTLAQAGALAEAAGDHYLTAGVLSATAYARHVQDGTPGAALALHRRALAYWERFGNRHAVNIGRYNVAVFEFHCGRAGLALEQLDALAAEATVLQDWRRVAVVHDARGSMLATLRRWPEAVQAHRDSLVLAWQSMSIYNLAYAFWNLPRALAHVDQADRALQLAAFAETFWQARLGALTQSDQRDMLRVRRLAARRLTPPQCARAWAIGSQLSLAEAKALAIGD